MTDIKIGGHITFDYTNWRGESSIRTCKVLKVGYGSTHWHKEPGFLMTGHESGKGIRHYAMKDMSNLVVCEP